jgi:AcrR family transcriptional regulator
MNRHDRRRPDGEGTRATILEVAGRVFAQQGRARTTGKDVAAAAGVNTAAINYYFGGVEGLYAEVLAEAHRRLVPEGDLARLADPTVPAPDRLRTLMAEALRTILSPDEAWAMRVIGREVIAPSPAFASFAREVLAPKQEVVRRLVAEIMGRPVDDPSVAFALSAAMAPLDIMLVADPEVVATQIPPLAADPADLEIRLDRLHRFVLGGLRALATAGEGEPDR